MKVMDKSSVLQKMQVTSDHRPRKCFYNIYHTFVTGMQGTKTAINYHANTYICCNCNNNIHHYKPINRRLPASRREYIIFHFH